MHATGNLEAADAVAKMRAQEVGAEGCVWFFSGADSTRDALLRDDPRVRLMICNEGKREYLAVYGQATASIGRDKINGLWGPMAKAWSPEGTGDPNLTVIRERPEMVHYRDTRGNQQMAPARVLAGAVTGPSIDAGVEGDLDP
jgi:general stress protein 26